MNEIDQDTGDRIQSLSFLIKEATEKINAMHAAVFGIEGKGGLYAMVEDHEKALAMLKDDIKQLEAHKNKATGALTVLSVLCGALGAVIGKWLR